MGLVKWELLDEWSKKCIAKHKPEKKRYHWVRKYGVIIINYIVHLLRQQGHTLEHDTRYEVVKAITTS